MTITAPKEADILGRVKDFALTHITPRRHELITATEFPKDLWEAFSESGLAGLSVPEEHGGYEASYQTLSTAAHLLNLYGGVPGVTMVFMAHWQFTKLHIVGDASPAMQRQLLPLIKDGKTTLCVAISEPGAGAHPKHLKTTAQRNGDEFILNGEKTYLTNGPLADFFIVLAITEEKKGRKAFSAILVPADTNGFQRTDGVTIDFLHPCPHGGIKLENCRVPVTNLIGIEGDAFERTSLRMRAIEDAAGAAGQVGSFSRLLDDITPALSVEHATELGSISTQILALDVVARKLAKLADITGNDVQTLLELQLGFRQISRSCDDTLQKLLESVSEEFKPETTLLARDITKFQSIANNASQARLAKIGLEALKESDARQ
ncbi:MAG: acyl-CoA/acyl-ACP dehydrogenase [Sneathiella sp.]|nr:acyl-CoA/acyl-ACP dehydrogenase [Sneathiella sp.]